MWGHRVQFASELPESKLYEAAADLEREVDEALQRERARIGLMALGRERAPKKLRLILQSRHFHQAAPPPVQPAAGPPFNPLRFPASM